MIKVGEPIQGSDKEKGLRRERELNCFFYLELSHLLRFQIHSLNSQMGQDPRSFSPSGQSQARVAHIPEPPSPTTPCSSTIGKTREKAG